MSLFFTLLTVCLFSAPDVSAASTDNQSSYQTAFLYFLPDYEPNEVDKAEARGCAKLGYTVTIKDCIAPRILKDKCPVGNVYKECYCAGSPTCSGSSSSSNPYSSSTGALRTSCTNCAGDTLYAWTCSGCSAYGLDACPSHGSCSQCCNGKYKLDFCSSGYSVSENSCEEDCTPLSSETECEYGTESCSDGCGGTRTCCTGCTLTDCADTVTSKPANSSYTTSSCTDCSGTKTIKTGWSCDSGYTQSGSSCELIHTHSYSCPSGYNETNSWGSSAQTASKTCSCGATSGTCYKAPSCTPKAAATGCLYGTVSCDDGCGGTTTCCASCTPKAAATGCSYGTESCDDGCGGTTTCCKGDPCASTICPTALTCSKGCKTSSTATSCCTSVCIECNTCVSGGSESCSGQTTVCSYSQVQTASCKDCDGNVHYTCRAKTCAEQGLKDCNGSCIATSECCGGCPSGKSCSNGTCVCSLPTCTSSVSTKPANSSYTTSSCTDCSGSHTINTGWTCNSGYNKSGSSCVCATTCSDKVTTKPTNSHYTTQTCTACGSSKTINSGWACDSGYEKSGNSCVKSVPNCSDSGSYGGQSCSNWSGADCMEDYGALGRECLNSGTTPAHGIGRCDVDSWRSCCEQCNGRL